MDEFVAAAKAALCAIWQVLNTNFSAAMFGALFGAVGAQLLGTRAERRKRIVEEIRSTNAAINVAFAITTTYCSLKEQHVRGMKGRFDAQRKAHDEFRSARNAGQIPKDQFFDLQVDFESIAPIGVPIATLRDLLFEKLTLIGRPLLFGVFLSQSIDDLNAATLLRNEIIADCNKSPPDDLISLYFGLKAKAGRVDRRYAASLEGMHDKTNDAIFLGVLLVEDLEEHGKQLVAALGKNAPQITTIDFTKAREKGLIPDAANYTDWMSLPKASKLQKGIVRAPKSKLSRLFARWSRLWRGS
jgi:hypothetical protein